MTDAPSPATSRTLGWQGFVAIAIAYVVVLKVAGLLIGVDTPDDTPYPTTEAVLRNGVLPIGISALFAIGVVSWLGWWPIIWRSDRPVQHWVRWVPISMLVVAILAVNYGHLADQTAGLVLLLVVMTALVGFTEELMFRGVGVQTFRRGGFPEARVALWSSLLFGLVHLSNALTEGTGAVVQAVVVSTSGYFFYLALRSSHTLVVPMVAHALWDFSLLSSFLGPHKPEAYVGSVLIILLQVVLVVVLIARRHRVEPAEAVTAN